jgi:hypothetical protein
MAEARTCEVYAALAPLNTGSWNNVWQFYVVEKFTNFVSVFLCTMWNNNMAAAQNNKRIRTWPGSTAVVPKVWGAPPWGGGARDPQGGLKRCVEKKNWTEFAFRNFQWTLFAIYLSPGTYYEFHHTIFIINIFKTEFLLRVKLFYSLK